MKPIRAAALRLLSARSRRQYLRRKPHLTFLLRMWARTSVFTLTLLETSSRLDSTIGKLDELSERMRAATEKMS